ncbi:MAG: diphthine--ammonia ligase [Ekhidna sp.]|nr:diphthine--ammonia ligase [Ekhidna sp.]MBC6410966.1 diphthine--ammonia ligase [Ekhidna sp.]
MGKVLMSWSGGKDCTLALHHFIKNSGKRPDGALTVYNTKFNRVTMHGVPIDLIKAQSEALEMPLFTLGLPENVTDKLYEELLLNKFEELMRKGFDEVVFGDIFLEDLRTYRIRQLEKVGLKYQFPIWKRATSALIGEFVSLGFKTMIVSINGTVLSADFAGMIINDSFIKALPGKVDPCGENGEFHTFVYDGPIFKNEISFKIGETIERKYVSPVSGNAISYWFTDLIRK